MVILPTLTLSIIRFSLLVSLLNSEVFVLMLSTKASCDPFITTSFSGFEIPLCLKPLISISKHVDNVSINNAQFPELTLENISVNVDCCFILF